MNSPTESKKANIASKMIEYVFYIEHFNQQLTPFLFVSKTFQQTKFIINLAVQHN